MENPKKLKNIKVALLGHGEFAKPSFAFLKKHFKITAAPNAQLLVVANYGRILKKNELESPEWGAINIHPSLLPKYRGPTPIQTALLNGEKTTGVTIFRIDEKIDHGPIIAQRALSINLKDDYQSLEKKLALLAKKIIEKKLFLYLAGKITPTPQKHSQATYTKKITIEEAKIKPSDEPLKIYNKIRALGKEPGVFINLPKIGSLKILKAKIENKKLIPLLVQRPGKKIISYRSFLNGYKEKPPF